MQNNNYTKVILDSLVKRSQSFLKEEMSIDIISISEEESSPPKVELQKNTSMISVSGSVEILIVMGYNDALLEKLIDAFLEGEEVEDDELDEIRESVSSEIVNIIVGNALFNPVDNTVLHISPPILIYEAKFLFQQKNSHISITRIETQFGDMLLSTIMPSKTIPNLAQNKGK